MPIKYLISGATGNIGGGVISYFNANNISKELYAATSSSPYNRKRFETLGIQFRHLNYDDAASMEKALQGVENFFFVASNIMDHEQRSKQHQRVIDTAKKMNVGHVWYTSLAFGGYKSESKVTVQQAHFETERMLERSRINYTVIREAIYAETWWMLLGYNPNSKIVLIPADDGRINMVPRDELAEANAKLLLRCEEFKGRMMINPTGPKAYTWTEVVAVINKVTGRDVKIQRVSRADYGRFYGGMSGQSSPHLKAQLSWFEGIANGDLETVDPIMEQLLCRRPTDLLEYIEHLLQKEAPRS